MNKKRNNKLQVHKKSTPKQKLSLNHYEVLQEERETLHTEEESLGQDEEMKIQKILVAKRKSLQEPIEVEHNTIIEQTPMDIEINKEYLRAEERVLKRLLHEWRNLDDRFIPEDQKKLYK